MSQMARSIFLKVSRGVSLTCLCIVVVAVVVAPLELLFYPFLKSIGCSLSDGQQGFTCDGWIGGFTSPVLNLPILFSDAREFTFGPQAPSGRGVAIYLFDGIFILALAYPLLILFAGKGRRRGS
ncbi:hypothetical protein SAMN05216573_12097 [Bradyrhizobium sp. Rc3b]|uniref:hypothetical protein n=1 Tax=unclassified Bradyrhizobium TaxID=2631580 RepID=UPI0008E231BC|nr:MULTISPECIES: hypothetical protein [unclassified Bradyrhizobium]MBB4378354.1 hypothetical protein [Bradyrhizobium sp. SBR1B]SFN74806.1 hypothetical protein SAMN05216573_12097 [Bradyrhizobium sp. Rc3b]